MNNRALLTTLMILSAFFIISNLFPNVLLILLLFTFGLGFPLLFLNTVFIYLLAALPALVLMRSKPRNWGAIAGAATLIPAVAIVPPLISQVVTASNMQRFLSDDKSANFSETPRSIELVGDALYSGGPKSPLKNAPCDTLCQRLLLSRHVDVVRVKRESPRAIFPGQLDYVLEQRDHCSDAFGDGETLLSETKNAIVSGVCFVAREPSAASMAARIEVRNTAFPASRNLLQDMEFAVNMVSAVQVLKISAAEPGGWSLKLQKTQVTYSHWRMPLYLFFADCGGLCMCEPVLGRIERKLNAFDPAEVALHMLRIEEHDPRDPLNPAARVMAMLDRAGDTLTDNQNLLIREWVISLLPCTYRGCQPIAGKDEEVVMRLVKDRRVANFALIQNLIEHNRRLVEDNMDLFLDEMEARGANSQFSNAIGAIFTQLDNNRVRAKRDRILALIRGNDWKWSRGMGILSGRLGIDTADLISERLGWASSAATASLAACLADDNVSRELVPALLDYLRTKPGRDDRADDASRGAVIALARFGHFDEARELYLARYPKLGEQSLPRQSAAAAVHDINACYRG